MLYIDLRPGWAVKIGNAPVKITGAPVEESSSSSYRAGSTDIPDPLSPLLPIVHRPR